jgi:hypothetical protein
MTLGNQALGQMEADKARCAGDDELHYSLSVGALNCNYESRLSVNAASPPH